MLDYKRVADAARGLAPSAEEADLASAVRSLARGRGPTFVGVEGAAMLVRELLAALEVPPRGPAAHRPLASMALDLIALPRRSLAPPETTWEDVFVGSSGLPPLYPPAAERSKPSKTTAPPDALRIRWTALRADLGLPADDAALSAHADRTFQPTDDGETLALPARTERLLLRDHGPRHAPHAELDLEDVRAFLHGLDLDLASLSVEPGRVARLWLRPGKHHATAVSLTLDGALRSVFFAVHAEEPGALLAELAERYKTEDYEELLGDVGGASRDDETFARALIRMALGAPHHEEPRALRLFDEAFHSESAGARGAAVIGAGITRWLALHDPVVRQKGDDDPAVRDLAERIAPSLDPTLD